MMLSKDAARIIGRIGFLLPLLLISLIAANTAAACPEKRTSAAFRTKAINTRTVAYMSPTVITYRAPATYRLCGNSLYDTRRVKYVALRGNGYQNGARYVAVRNSDRYYEPSRTRYIAVRDVAYDAPRYVTVRRSSPMYVADSGVRYVAVRNTDRYYAPSRTRYIAVRNIDIDDDAPRYVAVRRAPVYVENPDTRYIAVRDIDRETNGTNYAAIRNESNIGAEDLELKGPPDRTNHVVQYTDATYSNGSTENHLITAEADDACPLSLASRTSPDVVTTRTVSYDPMEDDIDDYAFLKPNTRRYVATAEMVRPASYLRADADDLEVDGTVTKYVETSDAIGRVNYVPIDDRIADIEDDDVKFVAARDTAGTVRYLPINDDVAEIDNDDVTYVAANGADDTCLRRVAVRACPDELDTGMVSYVPVDDAPRFQTVSYVPVSSAVQYRSASYATANELYQSDTEIDACPMDVSSLSTQPKYISDSTTTVVEVDEADYAQTNRIARHYGLRDGLEDGQDAAAEADAYHPENSGDYQKATNGYEDTFGDKDLYKESYRAAYLSGYRSGFDSIVRREEPLG